MTVIIHYTKIIDISHKNVSSLPLLPVKLCGGVVNLDGEGWEASV